MSTPMMAAREALGELPNPLGLCRAWSSSNTPPAARKRWARRWSAWVFSPWRATARARCCCTARAT